MRWIALAVAFAGCGGNDVTRVPLADLTEAPVTIFVTHLPTEDVFLRHVLRVDVNIQTADEDCVSLPANATAMFNYVPLTIQDAHFEQLDDLGCGGVGIYRELDAYSFTTQPSQIVISDGDTTWTATVAGTDGDLTVGPLTASAPLTATWNRGPAIGEADFWYTDSHGQGHVLSTQGGPDASIQVDANNVAFVVPTDIASPQSFDVQLLATVPLGPTPDANGSLCIGPTQCTAELEVGQTQPNAILQP